MKITFVTAILLLTLLQHLPAKTEFAVYPSLGFSDETGIYAGGLTYIRYNCINGDSTSKKNLIYFASEISEKKQFSIHLKPELHFYKQRYTLITNFKAKHWPSTYYGIGNNYNPEISERYTKRKFDIEVEVIKNISKFWQASLIYDLTNYRIVKMEENGLLASEEIPGSEDNITSGLGFAINYDKRNSNTYPINGYQYSFKTIFFSSLFASDYSFLQNEIDLRYYIPIFPSQTLAIQTYFSTISDKVPFHKLSYLDDNMRALTSNKFIDRNALVFRLENRIFPWSSQLLERIGFIIFFESGEVAESLDDFSIDGLKLSYGAGFRVSFLMNDRLNVRLDIGFGEKNRSLSMGSREEF